MLKLILVADSIANQKGGHKATAWIKWNRMCHEKEQNGRRGQTWGQSQINVENIGTTLRDSEKKCSRAEIYDSHPHFHVLCFQLPVFQGLYLLQERSRQLSQIKHLTSKWLISSQGRAVVLGSKFQSCSASCSASSTWKSFPLWDLVTWNHSQSVCNTVMCNCCWLWKMLHLQHYRLLWTHLQLPHS